MKQIMTDKEKIMEWVRARSGRPQKIDYPDAELDTVGIRINFPGSEDDVYVSEGQSLADINWDEFFKIFEQQQLAFEYDDDEEVNSLSYQFVKRNDEK